VLVTGASGFLGRHVTAHLADAGWSVTGAVRSRTAHGIPAVHVTGTETASALRPLVKGCTAVVHLAGRAHVIRETAADPAAAFRLANADLAARFAQAADAEGVKDFILMSSIAAVSNSESTTVSDDQPASPDTDYGRSKLEGEDAVERCAADTHMRVVCLRPPMIYGEYMQGNPLRLFRQIVRRLPVPAARPPVLRSMMYAGNLAEAVSATLSDDHVQGRFCVADQPAMSVDAFVRGAADAMGVRALLLPLPAWLLQHVGTLQRMTRPLVVDDSRFRGVSGFQPPYTTDDAIRRTAAWYSSSQGEP
ncbi:MAG TPA: NAD-dependent epimerase/dehydratase family protein, partial [Longimicrobiales bacterium]